MGITREWSNPPAWKERPAVISLTAAFVLAGSLLATLAWAQDNLAAREALNRGVQAFKESRYAAAIELFERAKHLDPKLLNARLYLATAYATMYIPGAPSDENIQYAEKAITEFKAVLEIEPDNLGAIDGAGSILYNVAGTPYSPEKFEASKRYHLKHIEIAPKDPDPYYWVGVIDWTLAFRANSQRRAAFNERSQRDLRDFDPLPNEVRAAFVRDYGAIVDEGIQHLHKAIELKNDYDSAFAYLNLLYRQRADQVDSPADRARCIAFADALIEDFKRIKQKKMEEASRSNPPVR